MSDSKETAEGRQTAPNCCKICGDCAGCGVNFGCLSCESCKAFFRRCSVRSQSLKCPFSGHCRITKASRRACQACRLAKCIRNGMRKELVDVWKKMRKKTTEIENGREGNIEEKVNGKKKGREGKGNCCNCKSWKGKQTEEKGTQTEKEMPKVAKECRPSAAVFGFSSQTFADCPLVEDAQQTLLNVWLLCFFFDHFQGIGPCQRRFGRAPSRAKPTNDSLQSQNPRGRVARLRIGHATDGGHVQTVGHLPCSATVRPGHFAPCRTRPTADTSWCHGFRPGQRSVAPRDARRQRLGRAVTVHAQFERIAGHGTALSGAQKYFPISANIRRAVAHRSDGDANAAGDGPFLPPGGPIGGARSDQNAARKILRTAEEAFGRSHQKCAESRKCLCPSDGQIG